MLVPPQVVDRCGLTEGHRSSDDPKQRDVLGGTDLGPLWDHGMLGLGPSMDVGLGPTYGTDFWDLGMEDFGQIMVDVIFSQALVNLSGLYKQKLGLPSGGFKHICETCSSTQTVHRMASQPARQLQNHDWVHFDLRLALLSTDVTGGASKGD